MRFRAHEIPNRPWTGITVKKDDQHAIVKDGKVTYGYGKVFPNEEFELDRRFWHDPPRWADPVDDEAKALMVKVTAEREARRAEKEAEAEVASATMEVVAEATKNARKKRMGAKHANTARPRQPEPSEA